MSTQALVVAALIALCITADREAVAGAIVRGDLVVTPDPRDIGAADKDATTTLEAFSKQQDRKANNDTGSFIRSKGEETRGPALKEISGEIKVERAKGQIEKYFPVVGLKNQPKKVLMDPRDFQEVGSRSGDYQGVAVQELTAGGKQQIRAGAFDLSRGATSTPGRAAGDAYDPYMIPVIPGGGSYDYGAVLNASLQFSNSASFGGVEFYAVDSTVFTEGSLEDFIADGSPFEDTLWRLSISGASQLTSTSGVTVNFVLNPEALAEISLPSSYLLMLPGYSPGLTDAQIAALIDEKFDSSIGQALTYDGRTGTVSLKGYSLFPDGTLYRPDGNVVYADGVNAGLTEIPEPSALWLVVGGLIGMAAAGGPLRHKFLGLLR